MTDAVEKAPWSRRRWVVVVLTLSMVEVLAIIALGRRNLPSLPMGEPVARIVFAGSDASASALGKLADFQDPVVFTQADARGFSSVNWLAQPRFSVRVTNWAEPFRPLASTGEYFADDFSQFVAEAVQPSILATEKVSPQLAALEIPLRLVPRRALVRLQGGLAGRALAPNQLPPLNETNVVLTNTVIRLVVNGLGETLSAALLASGGLPKADQAALTFAKQAKFLPSPEARRAGNAPGSAGLAFGEMVFQWLPFVPATTNMPSSRP